MYLEISGMAEFNACLIFSLINSIFCVRRSKISLLWRWYKFPILHSFLNNPTSLSYPFQRMLGENLAVKIKHASKIFFNAQFCQAKNVDQIVGSIDRNMSWSLPQSLSLSVILCYVEFWINTTVWLSRFFFVFVKVPEK